MSQPVSRETLMLILQSIAALYRMNIISSETRKTMVELTQKGKEDKFDALYDFCQTLPTHPIRDEIQEIILFQN